MPADQASRPDSVWPGAASTPPSATRPVHYATLEAVFALGLVGVIAVARRRADDGQPPIPLRDLPVLALASFALADTVVKQKVSTWLREPFVVEGADHKPVNPEGRGLRHAVGELLTCTRCVGTWSALTLVGLRTASPAAGTTVANVLALAAANDIVQSGFHLLCAKADLADIAADAARDRAP